MISILRNAGWFTDRQGSDCGEIAFGILDFNSRPWPAWFGPSSCWLWNESSRVAIEYHRLKWDEWGDGQSHQGCTTTTSVLGFKVRQTKRTKHTCIHLHLPHVLSLYFMLFPSCYFQWSFESLFCTNEYIMMNVFLGVKSWGHNVKSRCCGCQISMFSFCKWIFKASGDSGYPTPPSRGTFLSFAGRSLWLLCDFNLRWS